MIGFIEAPIALLEKFGVNVKIILTVLGVVSIVSAFLFLDFDTNTIFGYMIATAPIWLPFATFLLFFEYWLSYVRKKFDISYGRVTIEIKIPQEIFKSPEAMELVLIQMYQTASPDNHKESYIDGKHPPTTSLELVSRGGDVRFYMSVPRKRYKDLCEAQLYAHYPGIEVHELDIDYTAEVPWDPKRFGYFMFHLGLKKADALPIKTYIEFGLDKMPKEEEKIDPINTVLEVLGSIDPREHVWVQILIEANKEWTLKEGNLGTTPDWKNDAKKYMQEEIIDKAVERRGGGEGKGNIMMLLTDTEKDTIKSIERSLGKLAFNTIIRCVYICPQDNVRIGDIIPRMITMWRAFEDVNRNSISFKWRTDFDWPWWQDPSGHKREHMKKEELDEYKRRVLNIKGHYSRAVMTTEELATIYHFPGKVASTPTLARIPSKRAQPPANLPIG